MKIIAEKAKCQGHARCIALAPEVFELDENGYIAFEEAVVPPDLAGKVRRAVRACPERILSIKED